MAKKRIAILFGGTSPEHDISCMSAWFLLRNMPAKYETVCIGITRKGRMLYYPGDADGIRSGEWESYPDSCSCIFSTDDSKTGIYKLMNDGSASYLGWTVFFRYYMESAAKMVSSREFWNVPVFRLSVREPAPRHCAWTRDLPIWS